MPTGKGFSTTSEEMASACSSSLGGNLTKRTRRKFPRLACGGQSSYATLLHGLQAHPTHHHSVGKQPLPHSFKPQVLISFVEHHHLSHGIMLQHGANHSVHG